ncbi:MAG: cyclase family protein [Chlorobi bacterium]|nr:cyclase family protein [Chlorobiota bacterium]
MHATIECAAGTRWSVELGQPHSISTRLYRHSSNRRAYFLPGAEIHTYRSETFIGSVTEGGSVNCDRLVFYPHGNGTHTECVGHISHTPLWIADCIRSYVAIGQLVSIEPQRTNGGAAITAAQLDAVLNEAGIEAAIIRTLPNDVSKCDCDWSGANPPYFTPDAAELLCRRGIVHLLIDLPSLDPENDGGVLAAHRAFWNYPAMARTEATVTELCYIANDIPDGTYFVQLGVISIESDAMLSHVVLYPARRLAQ